MKQVTIYIYNIHIYRESVLWKYNKPTIQKTGFICHTAILIHTGLYIIMSKTNLKKIHLCFIDIMSSLLINEISVKLKLNNIFHKNRYKLIQI